MKCYTDCSRELVEGIGVVDDEKLGPVVFLGERGRGRRFEKVAMSRREWPVIVDGRVYRAQPDVLRPKKGGEFIILRAPNKERESPLFLVRVRTQCVYARDSAGFWKTLKGFPRNLIMGHGAHGIAGRIGTWDDGLVVMAPGDALKVKPEGGFKTSAHVLHHAGDSLERMLFSDWEIACALSEDCAR